LGPTGLSAVILKTGLNLNKLQTGYIYHYTSVVLIFSGLFFCLKELLNVFNFFLDYRLFVFIIVLSFFITDKWRNI
jgi:hypothetical protein